MRLIDADAFIKKLEGKDYGWIFNYDDVLDAIDELSTVEQNKWILTSEKLPEVGEDVLVSVEKFNSKRTDVAYMLYDSETAEYWFENHLISYGINDVIAWMPLPAPLKLEEL